MKMLVSLLRAVLVVASVPAVASAADVLVRVRVHADAAVMLGHAVPARDEVVEYWISPERVAVRRGDEVTLVDVARRVRSRVNHRDRSYVEFPLVTASPRSRVPVRSADSTARRAEPVPDPTLLGYGDSTTVGRGTHDLPPPIDLRDAAAFRTTVTPVAEVRTIGPWPCAGWDVVTSLPGTASSSSQTLRIWTTTAVPAPLAAAGPDLVRYLWAAVPDARAEIAKITGFPIASELLVDTSGRPLRSTMDVVDIIEQPAPAGMFDVPAGYRKK